MAFKPSSRRSRQEEDTELNLLPVMNLMVCLIPLLLSIAQFTQLALLEYLPPAAEGGGGGENKDNQEPELGGGTLSLLVNLTESAVQVSMFGKLELGPYFYEIPRLADGKYNLKALTDSLWSTKQREVGSSIGLDSSYNDILLQYDVYPKYKLKDGRECTLTAMPETPFQVVIAVMDACKAKEISEKEVVELFPTITLKKFG